MNGSGRHVWLGFNWMKKLFFIILSHDLHQAAGLDIKCSSCENI